MNGGNAIEKAAMGGNCLEKPAVVEIAIVPLTLISVVTSYLRGNGIIWSTAY